MYTDSFSHLSHGFGNLGIIYSLKIGITVKEKEDGNYKISMRSAGDADVSAVCANFGGGGHKAAAGCTVSGTLEEVERAVVTAAGEAI